MNLDSIKADIRKGKTSVLKERYTLYQDLRSMGVMDVIVRDLLELELARRGVFDDLSPFRTINS